MVTPLIVGLDVALWHGDALDVLPRLADGSMQACITSPPYLDARPEYPSPTLAEFEAIFRELRRVAAGPLLLNLGRLFRDHREVRWHEPMLNACERAGWDHLDTKVWVKPNANPIHGEVFVNSHEYVYVLGVAGDDLNIDDVRRPHADSTRARFARGWTNHRGVKGFPDTKARKTTRGEPNPLGALPRSYIECNVGGDKGNPHPAPLARGVAADLVRLACPEGGWILDPFAGSCNVGVEAIAAGRRFVGIDLDRDYLEHPLGGGRLAQGSLLLAKATPPDDTPGLFKHLRGRLTSAYQVFSPRPARPSPPGRWWPQGQSPRHRGTQRRQRRRALPDRAGRDAAARPAARGARGSVRRTDRRVVQLACARRARSRPGRRALMGVTRDPALGTWCVFEGDVHKTSKEAALPWGGDVNEPVEWPVTLRVFYIRDGLMRSIDVEVDEQLEATVKPVDEASARG